MVCPVCQRPASLACPMCHQSACAEHTLADPGGYRKGVNGIAWQKTTLVVCSSCAKGWQDDTESVRKACWCEGCKDVNLRYYGAPTARCTVCGKKFCDFHGHVLAHFHGSKVDCWIRCHEHAVADLDKGSVGWLKRRLMPTPDFVNLTSDEFDAKRHG